MRFAANLLQNVRFAAICQQTSQICCEMRGSYSSLQTAANRNNQPPKKIPDEVKGFSYKIETQQYTSNSR
jgi:hypothetical protein